jgi:glycosyltransferase involved in cell wall biosynthesis
MRVERPDLSIVVPTHRRPAIHRTCLEHLKSQSTRDQLEVIVVSDGHDPETAAIFEDHNNQWGMPVMFVEIEKSHQGKARNIGVQHARADTCLFIQDDIFLAPNACDEHLLSHAALQYAGEQDVAVLGYTCWDPALTMTRAMRWLDKTGWQFGYSKIEQYAEDFLPQEIQHRYTYTSHLSLPTVIAKQFSFREDVTLYGWEDVEWGLRLSRAGVRLFYLPTSKALHHHPIDLPQSLHRMETLGESLVTLSRVNPALDRLPKGWKRAAYQGAALLPSMRGRHANAFLKGIRKGEKGQR